MSSDDILVKAKKNFSNWLDGLKEKEMTNKLIEEEINEDRKRITSVMIYDCYYDYIKKHGLKLSKTINSALRLYLTGKIEKEKGEDKKEKEEQEKQIEIDEINEWFEQLDKSIDINDLSKEDKEKMKKYFSIRSQ